MEHRLLGVRVLRAAVVHGAGIAAFRLFFMEEK